jgi:UDP:flavonoid glycosyltransferase YjiC (YdhE family)/predicted Ser/Thr protein kinase
MPESPALMTQPTTIAHYRITSKLGQGGMGTVYRATDVKLNREVAIKVLPDALAGDPDYLARFTREAQVLASLNHPNIAAIYGIEDRAIVMELVEGENLRGPLPLDTALNYARQITEAFEAAHEKGVIHRDLKPANVKVTPEGVVKVLDFGLAKTAAAAQTSAAHSPTLTIRSTQLGVILGTAAYMSPEQAAGKPVDKRADIWSFGVVLYEMLSGAQLFEGETVAHTLADVLRADIDLTKLPASTPRAIRDLIARCLDRDPRRRLRDIGEARVIEIHRIFTNETLCFDMGLAHDSSRRPDIEPTTRCRIALPVQVVSSAANGASETRDRISMSRKRILFLAEGATMAHFVRPLVLADALDASRYEVHFYAPSRFCGHLKDRSFFVGELGTMAGEQFLANLDRGAPAFPASVIRGYVQQDRELIRSIKPDLVVGDMRLSLAISARLESAVCAVMINAYWSPYTRHRSLLPSIPLTRVIPPFLLGPVYRLAEPRAYAAHVGELNRVRKELGVPALPPDLRVMYTEGDYVLYPDIPEFVPASDLPENHHYVGICQWTPQAEKPEWWDRMRADPKPKVFVSLGSSGPVRALPALLQALSKLPVAVIVSTSGRAMPPEGPATYVAGLLPFTETAAEASVVVSHGGSGGLYPAIAAGTPVLGIPSNADQHLSTAVLEESGAGLGVRVEEANRRRLRGALEKLLFDPQYRKSAQQWAEIYSRYDSGVMFRKFVDDALDGGNRSAERAE